MIPSLATDCPAFAEEDPPFSSLRAIDRIGEDFCQRPQNLQRISDIQGYRSFRMCCLQTTLSIVDACGVPNEAAVSVRLKRLDSIRRKISRSQTHFTLGRLDDVVGVRVICPSLSSVREFSERVSASPNCYRVKDYLKTPGSSGYRGLHHIIRFDQPVTDAVKVSVRFEVQVRTVLQHRWAVWSESHGEAIKLGVGAEQELERLRSGSRQVARWEGENFKRAPVQLPRYAGGRSIAVCWRTRHGPPIYYPFHDDVEGAVAWLNNLESTYHAERGSALLLVGVTTEQAAQLLLRMTHPLFTGVRVLEPEHWMPESSSADSGK